MTLSLGHKGKREKLRVRLNSLVMQKGAAKTDKCGRKQISFSEKNILKKSFLRHFCMRQPFGS